MILLNPQVFTYIYLNIRTLNPLQFTKNLLQIIKQ